MCVLGACSYHADCVEALALGSAIAARVDHSAEALSDDDATWDGVVVALAATLQTLVMTATPRLILIGGGEMGGNARLPDAVRAPLTKALHSYVRTPVLDLMAN